MYFKTNVRKKVSSPGILWADLGEQGVSDQHTGCAESGLGDHGHGDGLCRQTETLPQMTECSEGQPEGLRD